MNDLAQTQTPVNHALHPDLRRTLILGLTRAPLSADALHLQSIQDTEFHLNLKVTPAETAIWQVLATHALLSKAGYIAPKVNVRLVPALPDERITCPAKIAHFFALMQKDIHSELLEEWLYLLKKSRFAVPHTDLPALLEIGRKRNHLRADIQMVADKRGEWLIQHNSSWRETYLTDARNIDKDWNLGDLKQRSHAFRAMRLQDPLAALTALQQDWAKESAESRSTLLPLLSLGLSMSDENFLEFALDDSRQEVRQSAQQLLRNLPESRLVKRCVAHLVTLIKFEKKLFRANTLTVTLPESDPALLRDAIQFVQYLGLGNKASALYHLIVSAPPSLWLNTLQLTPLELVTLILSHEHKLPLFIGLLQSTVHALNRQTETPEHIEQLTQLYPLLLQQLIQDADLISYDHHATDAFKGLDSTQQVAILRQWLSISDDVNQTRQIIAMCTKAIATCRIEQIYSWSATLSNLVTVQVTHLMRTSAQYPWDVEQDLKQLARSILNHADVMQLASARMNMPLDVRWDQLIERIQELATFRQSLQQAFLS